MNALHLLTEHSLTFQRNISSLDEYISKLRHHTDVHIHKLEGVIVATALDDM